MAISLPQIRAWSPQYVAFEAEVTAAATGTLEARNNAWYGRVVINAPDHIDPAKREQRTPGFPIWLKAILGPDRVVQPGKEPTAQAALSTAEAYTVAHDHLLSVMFP